MPKHLITAILILVTLLIISCQITPGEEPVTCEDNIKAAFSAGWNNGANSVIRMVDDGTYSYEKLKLLHLKDSLSFAITIDNVTAKY